MKYFQIKLTKDCLSCQAPDCLFPGKYLRETFFCQNFALQIFVTRKDCKGQCLEKYKVGEKMTGKVNMSKLVSFVFFLLTRSLQGNSDLYGHATFH